MWQCHISSYTRSSQNKLILSLKSQPFWGLVYSAGVSTSSNGLCLGIKVWFDNLLFCDDFGVPQMVAARLCDLSPRLTVDHLHLVGCAAVGDLHELSGTSSRL